jgi:hypothetical protein
VSGEPMNRCEEVTVGYIRKTLNTRGHSTSIPRDFSRL